jgi:glyoxylase-like metal-dependent hydrolase (beta-lactamase superfamily II)
MNLQVIHTGNFKLDGGAMFGVVPKVIWQKINPADSNNLCTWSMRCLLVETGSRLILIDCGIGDKQSEKFFNHYYLHGDHTLEESIQAAGYSTDEVTDVFLTHLHFDHCGGALKNGDNGVVKSTFKNARYWSNRDHWQWAIAPNGREKASFLKENIIPIEESGQLNWVDIDNTNWDLFEIITVDGHTEKQMLPKIRYKGQTLIFIADLLPSIGHLPLPYVMSYDVRPLVTLKEKAAFLQKAADEEYILFFEHDPEVECCTLKHTEKGVSVDRIFKLKEI